MSDVVVTDKKRTGGPVFSTQIFKSERDPSEREGETDSSERDGTFLAVKKIWLGI